MQKTYYKIIGDNYGKFPYKLGLNKLSDNGEEFNEEPICGPGGLYYCEVEHIFHYVYYGTTLCRVTIPPEAKIVAVENKFKTDKIIIEEMMDLKDPSTFEMLIRAGADVHERDDQVLRWASFNGYSDVVKILLENGANVHVGDDFPLKMASSRGHLEVVKILLEYGANVHSNGYDALKWAGNHGHIVKILLENALKTLK